MRTSSCVAWLFDAVVHKDIVLLALTEHRPVQATLQNIGHTGHLTEHRPPYRTQARTGHLTEHRPYRPPYRTQARTGPRIQVVAICTLTTRCCYIPHTFTRNKQHLNKESKKEKLSPNEILSTN